MPTACTSATDWKRAAEIVADAAMHDSAEELAAAVVLPLMHLFEAELVIWDRFSHDGRPLAFCSSVDLGDVRQRLRPAFIEFFPQHPFSADLGQVLNKRGVYTLSDRTTNRAFCRTDLWNEVYIHLRARHQLTIGGRIDDVSNFTFALNRLGADFSSRERELARFLQPRLNALFRNIDRRRQAGEVAILVSRALKSDSAIYFFLNSRGELLRGSAGAKRWSETVAATSGQPLRLSGLKDLIRRSQAEHSQPKGFGRAAPYVFGTVEQSPAILMCHELEDTMLLLLQPEGSPPPGGAALSRREAEVLQWIREGKSNHDIGILLGISSRTVEKHCSRIFSKVGVENRTAAAVAARAAVE